MEADSTDAQHHSNRNNITGVLRPCNPARSGGGSDVRRWAKTQRFEGLNCLVVVRLTTVPHVAVVHHSEALLMLFL